MNAIEVRGLRKSYGDLEAVRGISFEVRSGEVLALLGPNGAGKTTTIEILEGYRRRSGGEVRVLGHDPDDEAIEVRRRVGIVLQSSAIDRFLSVGEVLEMYAGYYPNPLQVDDVLALVGLTARRDDRVRNLSGGQHRRLDVALGLIGDPDLLFLDEPTTGFDPSARRQAWDLVRNLRSLGKTVLLTTHYMDEAQSLADRIIIVNDGRIVAEGTADALGDRMARGAIVRFSLPENVSPPVDAERHRDGSWQFTSHDTTADLHRLTGWAIERSLPLDGLRVMPPTLEDIYLELTEEPQ